MTYRGPQDSSEVPCIHMDMCYTLLREVIGMESQNVTLSLPKDFLRRAKHLAIERNTSLSGLLTELLRELVDRDDAYQKAKERHLAALNSIVLETRGLAGWSRSEMHARGG